MVSDPLFLIYATSRTGCVDYLTFLRAHQLAGKAGGARHHFNPEGPPLTSIAEHPCSGISPCGVAISLVFRFKVNTSITRFHRKGTQRQAATQAVRGAARRPVTHPY